MSKKLLDVLRIEKGVHFAIVGQTGSGKSLLGMFLLHYIDDDLLPVVIYDVKHDNDFFKAVPNGYSAALVTGLPAFEDYLIRGREHLADFIIVRPTMDERADYKIMDDFLTVQYNIIPRSVAYLDETTFFLSSNGQARRGLLAMLNTGRSIGLTCVMCTQRPIGIARSIKSEARKFAIFDITIPDDRKDMTLIAKYPDVDLPRYHFWYYDVVEKQGEIMKPIKDVR